MNIYELYGITDEYKQLMDLAGTCDPEEMQTLNDTIEAKQGEWLVNVDGLIGLIKAVDNQEKVFDEESKRCAAKKKALRDFSDRVKGIVKANMEELGEKEIRTAVHKLKIVGNGGKQPLNIFGEVPEDYIKTEVIKSDDKEKIRAALEAGVELPFARLEERGTRLKID